MKQHPNKLFEVLWRQTLSVMVLVSLSKIGASVIDGFIMARSYGADSSAAMGIVSPFVTFTLLVGSLISTGCLSVCANHYAKGDVASANKAFVSSFYLGLSASLLIAAAAYLLAQPICSFLGANGKNADLLPETCSYLRGISFGAPAMVLNLLLAPIIQLYGGGAFVKRSILTLFLSDVLFDLLSVLLKLGSWGIGLATSLSNILCVLIMLCFLFSGKTDVSLSPKLLDCSVLPPILKQGLPDAVKRFFRMAGDIVTNIIVLATAAGAAMAGKTIGNLLACLFTVLGTGAASAAYLLAGTYISMEDAEGLLALGKKQLLHLLLTLIFTVLSILFTPVLVELVLAADAETKRTAVICIRCILVSMPLYVCTEMVSSYLQSIEHRKNASLLSFFSQTLFYLPLAALLGLRWGAVGVLLSAPLAQLLALALFYGMLCRRLRRMAGLRDIMHLSECIHSDEIDILARNTVQNIHDAVRCSEDVRAALLERGADSRTAFAVSLFTEEICSNIIEHGFRKSGAKRTPFSSHQRYASVFIFIHNGIINLRIYDNCILFDPAKKLKSLEEHTRSPERGLGLKLVFSMADEASYTSMLSMNHMLIRLPMHRSAPAAGRKALECRDKRFVPDPL